MTFREKKLLDKDKMAQNGTPEPKNDIIVENVCDENADCKSHLDLPEKALSQSNTFSLEKLSAAP